jgi:hypothetical protein
MATNVGRNVFLPDVCWCGGETMHYSYHLHSANPICLRCLPFLLLRWQHGQDKTGERMLFLSLSDILMAWWMQNKKRIDPHWERCRTRFSPKLVKAYIVRWAQAFTRCICRENEFPFSLILFHDRLFASCSCFLSITSSVEAIIVGERFGRIFQLYNDQNIVDWYSCVSWTLQIFVHIRHVSVVVPRTRLSFASDGKWKCNSTKCCRTLEQLRWHGDVGCPITNRTVPHVLMNAREILQNLQELFYYGQVRWIDQGQFQWIQLWMDQLKPHQIAWSPLVENGVNTALLTKQIRGKERKKMNIRYRSAWMSERVVRKRAIID